MKEHKLDVIICNYAYPYIVKTKYPIIILERLDSCTLLRVNNNSLASDNVVSLFKEYVCSDVDNYTRPQVGSRVHYTMLEKIYGSVIQKYAAPVDTKNYHKVRPLDWNLHQYSFICNTHMDTIRKLPPVQKDIDVFFVCHNHDHHDVLSKHRSIGRDIAKTVDCKIVTAAINGREGYLNMIMRSKICVCPYGLGSRIALDQISILGGAIAIKPDMSHVTTNTNLYTDDYFEFVNTDWSNLKETISKILNNYDKYSKIATERKVRAENKFTKEYYADQYVSAIESALH
jgi:hypothetical protein